MDLISWGWSFHRVGAATLKALSANVLCLVLGITSKSVPFDLSVLVHFFSCSKFLRYPRPTLVLHLWVSARIFCSILCFTGSQCRVFRHSLMLSLFDFLSTKCAYMFWRCSFLWWYQADHIVQSYNSLHVTYIGWGISSLWLLCLAGDGCFLILRSLAFLLDIS